MKINVKVKASFSFYKLSRYINSVDYDELKAESFGQPTVNAIKKFIKAGNVRPTLAEATKKTRRKRKSPLSIGGTKPLYDSGKLVKGLRYNKQNKSIEGLATNKKGDYYTKYHLKPNRTPSGKPIPARDFIDQVNKIQETDIGKSYFQTKAMKQLVMGIRKAFKRKLAK